jgi:hypothetical protein
LIHNHAQLGNSRLDVFDHCISTDQRADVGVIAYYVTRHDQMRQRVRDPQREHKAGQTAINR